MAGPRPGRLVWEPRLVVSAYGVPVADIAGRLVPSGPVGGRIDPDPSSLPPVLTPRNPFSDHSSPGTRYDIETEAGVLTAAAYVVDDPDLESYAVLDWEVFSTWFEEAEEAVGHPREPQHRIRCLPSTRHVVVEIGGEVVADTHRPMLLVETNLAAALVPPL